MWEMAEYSSLETIQHQFCIGLKEQFDIFGKKDYDLKKFDQKMIIQSVSTHTCARGKTGDVNTLF